MKYYERNHCGGASIKKYTNSIKKFRLSDFGHTKSESVDVNKPSEKKINIRLRVLYLMLEIDPKFMYWTRLRRKYSTASRIKVEYLIRDGFFWSIRVHPSKLGRTTNSLDRDEAESILEPARNYAEIQIFILQYPHFRRAKTIPQPGRTTL